MSNVDKTFALKEFQITSTVCGEFSLFRLVTLVVNLVAIRALV
jgi:hypothetical protein